MFKKCRKEKKDVIAPEHAVIWFTLKHLHSLPGAFSLQVLGILHKPWRINFYLQVHIRLYSSRLKVSSTLDPKACLKMLNKSMFEEGEKS